MRKGYVGTEGAQLHYFECGSENAPLICLPPAPHTGAFFGNFMPLIASQRSVRAYDYPGYGGSDRLTGNPSIKAYAKHITDHLDNAQKISLLGFHTGNLVAVEIAKLAPELISDLILIDVPYFDEPTREKYAASLPPNAIPDDVQAGFEKSVTGRHSSVPDTRAYELWVEGLRSGPFRADAFRAAFAYDCEVEFSNIKPPATVIATQSSLLEPTRQAAKHLQGARLIELLDVTAPAFESYAAVLAETVLSL